MLVGDTAVWWRVLSLSKTYSSMFAGETAWCYHSVLWVLLCLPTLSVCMFVCQPSNCGWLVEQANGGSISQECIISDYSREVSWRKWIWCFVETYCKQGMSDVTSALSSQYITKLDTHLYVHQLVIWELRFLIHFSRQKLDSQHYISKCIHSTGFYCNFGLYYRCTYHDVLFSVQG